MQDQLIRMTNMQKYIFLFSIISLTISASWAVTPGPGEVERTVRKADNFSSGAVYQSSHTCAASTLQAVYVSSPQSAYFAGILVSSPNPGAFIEVYDGQPSVALSRKIGYINAANGGYYQFNVAVSSWLGVMNQAGPTGNFACISTIFSVK